MLFFSQTSFQSKQFTRASLIAKSPTSNPPALKKNSLANTFNEYRTGYLSRWKLSTLSFCVSFNNRVCEWITNCVTSHGHFRVPKTLTFKMRPSAQPFLWKWVFIYTTMKNRFHIKGWALNLVLIQRPRGNSEMACLIMALAPKSLG